MLVDFRLMGKYEKIFLKRLWKVKHLKTRKVKMNIELSKKRSIH